MAKERERTQSGRTTEPPPPLNAPAEIDKIRQIQEQVISDLSEDVDAELVVDRAPVVTSVGIANRDRQQKSEMIEDEQDNAGIQMQVDENVAIDTTTIPALDADDEAAYLTFLASLYDDSSPEPTTTNTDTVKDEEVNDFADLDDRSEDLIPETTALNPAEGKGTEVTTEAASPLLDGDDETSFLLFLAEMPDAMEPRGPKEVEEDFLEDFEEVPSKEVREEIEQMHGEDMAIMDLAGTDVPIADTTPVTVSEVEVEMTTTEGAAASLEPNDEKMFLSFLEDFENIPMKSMHNEDMAIMNLASTDIPSPETTTTIVPEEIEATTFAAAVPSLDHDDESAFLSFLEDQENLPTEESEPSTVPTESTEKTEFINEGEEDVFGVEILVEEVGREEQERPNSAKELESEDPDSGEYPEMITDYFDTSDGEEMLDDLKPSVIEDSVNDEGEEDGKDRPDRGTAFNELLSELAKGLEAELDNVVGTGILTPDKMANRKKNNNGQVDDIDAAESLTVATDDPNSIEYEDFFVDTSEEEEEQEEDEFPVFENFPKKKPHNEVEIDETALTTTSKAEDSEKDPEANVEIKQKTIKNEPKANEKNSDEEEKDDEHEVTVPILDEPEELPDDDGEDDGESKLDLDAVQKVVDNAQEVVRKVMQVVKGVVRDELEDPKSPETAPPNRLQIEDSPAPSLDHDDEAAFLAFLEDLENPPTKELSTFPTDLVEVPEVKEESEAEEKVESSAIPSERGTNDNRPKNADLIRLGEGNIHSGPIGLGQEIQRFSFILQEENRINSAKKRIVDEFRVEGQIRAPGKLPSVSEMKYTVSITDVDGEKDEVLTTGSVSEIFSMISQYGNMLK